jgi:glycerophosphoryl diester phosphodiesterase
MQITAHRAGAAEAPENTLAAIRKAIEAGADWAEIDVQRSADGALVVLHDSDLRRVGGVPTRVAEMTLAQIRTIDAGSRFGEEFAGERIPTLNEMIAAAGNRIRLNIELKPHGKDDVAPLVEAVIATARDAAILGRCRICSQSYEGVRLARQLAPEVEIGFIAGASLGDLSKLEVDFLMVSTRKATRRLVERATARNMKIHAWTVNNPDLLLRLVDRGVANVITDDPAAMRARLQEIRGLHPVARLLLRTRNLLAD